ncbi:FtsK/SpoIIIE domain-containing protein [Paenibacillus sp. NRS-1783]|uniref:FtsK/SpoIIIE domain-containing protein n=1 Tax=Paenibacillus sp. NRS-1783 TaxID=3233907 RepID=UPI003D27E1A4
MQDFFSGRSSGGSGAPNPQGSGSFGAFFSKIAGTAAALSVAALFFETSPEIKELAKTVLKYSVVSWGIFVLLPYIFQLIIRAPGEAKSRTTSILKTLLVVVAFPYVIRMVWQHRKTWKEGIIKIIREKLGLPEINQVATTVSVPYKEMMNSSPLSAETITTAGTETLPMPLNLLPYNPNGVSESWINETNASDELRNAMQMAGFTVEDEVEIIAIENGPTLQTISFQLPPKVQFSALVRKRDDLGNHFGHQDGFDIVSTPYRSSAAFVIPNSEKADVYMRDVSVEFIEYAKKAALPIILGKDVKGKPKFADIAKFPHLLAAGATGGGKSVFLNTAITSLTSVRSPKEVRLLLVDPKLVELQIYAGLPHLLQAPITDHRRVPIALSKIVVEMEQRYEVLAKAGVRNIEEYNLKMSAIGGDKLPYILVIIDEYGDLMPVIGGEIEDSTVRLGQKARASGINIVLTTQRPSVDVVTGLIKSQLPSRMTFKMASSTDFRTVMDTTGPTLLGRGDGMFKMDGPMERFQSATIGNGEQSTQYIKDLVTYWKGQSRAQPPAVNLNKPGITPPVKLSSEGQLSLEFPELNTGDVLALNPQLSEDEEQAARDEEIYRAAIGWAKDPEIVFSVSWLQRRCRIGYSWAARIIDRMEQEGLIGPYDAQNPGRRWLGGNPPSVSMAEGDPPPWDEQTPEPAPVFDEYARFCKVIKENGGFSMSIVQEHLGMDGETASRHVKRMIGDGLLGDFDSNLKKRPYLDPDQNDQNDQKDIELLDRMKVYMCRTGSAKTNELRDVFQMRKEDILSLCKRLVEEGFLNDYTSKREGYTLAWSEEQRDQFLSDWEAREDTE